MRKFARNAAVGLGILVSSKSVSAQSKSPSGGVIGVDRLVLDEQPNVNVAVCYSGSSKSSSAAVTTDTLTIAPQSGASTVQVDFSVSTITPNTSGKPMVLFVAYSSGKATTPQIVSKNTSYPFLLSGGLQILAAYNIAPMTSQAQAGTTIGKSLSEPSARLTFPVALDMNQVNALIANSANKLYFQAGLMTQEGLAAADFSTLILSEVDTINFKSSCTGTTTVQAGSSGKTFSNGATSVKSSGGSKSGTSSTSGGSSKTGTSGGKSGGSSSTGGKS